MWRVRVDTGGTFTDCVAVDPEGRDHRAKVLSNATIRGALAAAPRGPHLRVRLGIDLPSGFLRGGKLRWLDASGPEPRIVAFDAARGSIELDAPVTVPRRAGDPFEVATAEEAPLLAAHVVTGTPLDRPLPPLAMRLATTRATNALLERRGARVVFVATQGLGDVLRIDDQRRPDLFALDARRPPPLHEIVVEVEERLAADGSILVPLDEERLRRHARDLVRDGWRIAAVALAHAYRNPAHERAVGRILREEGFPHVVLSSELAPRIGLLPRARTAVVEAYLAPVLRDHLDRVQSALGRSSLHVLTSAGGLVRGSSFRATDGLLSGPAGGVVGAAAAAHREGFPRGIAFDMGGTSTDVARFEDRPEVRFEHRVGDTRLFAPALAIESVAAGGGSICDVEAGVLRVGPRSAGADPGPACYGAGGPLTLTDVNLLLGRLDPARFPIPIDVEAARGALEDVRRRLAATRGEGGRPVRDPGDADLLEGFVAIADERMVHPIRAVSIRQGFDPADHALVAFGGAGGQHACAVAARLGIRTVLVPPHPSLLSAEGLDRALVERFAERQVLAPLAGVAARIEGWLDELAERAVASVAAEGVARHAIRVHRRVVRLRLIGQNATLALDATRIPDLTDRFRERYASRFGHEPDSRPLEVESLLAAASTLPAPPPSPSAAPSPGVARPAGARRMRWAGRWVDAPVFDREALAPGNRARGPALIHEERSTIVLAPGWEAAVRASGAIVLSHPGGRSTAAVSSRPRAVALELTTNRFRALVVEMGEQLRRTAVSTNVKEREDYSCALLDPEGSLVAHAPHIPVHLGSMGLCVRSVRDALRPGPGDVLVTNHPACGGSHLPDITVITPVHDHAGRLLGWVASRAHHAELGGIRPGSMPPGARSLTEEGVVLRPAFLVKAGVPRWDAMRRRLETAPHPSRAVGDNLADLRAAVAANHRGARALRELCTREGADVVEGFMRDLAARAEAAARAALGRLPRRRLAATERLDDGTPLRAAIRIRGDRAVLDFQGTAGVHPGSFNATPAIVRSVVLYVLRLLAGEALPLNGGLLRALDLAIPEGLLAPPFPERDDEAPAVVAGNVETSQRLADALVRALGLAAGSQGTMNNVSFGNDRFGYYETVGGGAGAGQGFDGGSAVHTHMTNTSITDTEILEHRYPVRVERFAVRWGSGGKGRTRGGDGIVRELTFLAPLDLSILSQHRRRGPRGLAGGRAGAPGRQVLRRAGGSLERLGAVAGVRVAPGDRLRLETPGGGGWGRPESRDGEAAG